MKEVTLSDEDIIKVLKEEKHIELEPICINCTHDVVELVLHYFNSVVVMIDNLENGMFSLMIRI